MDPQLFSALIECVNEAQLFTFAKDYAVSLAYQFQEFVGMTIVYGIDGEVIEETLKFDWDESRGAYCVPGEQETF